MNLVRPLFALGLLAALLLAPAPAAKGQTPRPGGAAPAPAVYPAGWNLISVARPGLIGLGGDSVFFTLPASAAAYQTAHGDRELQPGTAYWAYFSEETTAYLPPRFDCEALESPWSCSADRATTPLPPGQFVMVGNPFGESAVLSGADVVYTYSPAAGYQSTARLGPGQGAFALAAAGGDLTISPVAGH
jgi:hypothetical protein